MTEGTKACGYSWKRKRYLHASLVTIILMVLGIVAIVTLVGTADTGPIIAYAFIIFAVAIGLITVFCFLDHLSNIDDGGPSNQVKAKVKKKVYKRRASDNTVFMTPTTQFETDYDGYVSTDTPSVVVSIPDCPPTVDCGTTCDTSCGGDSSFSGD